MTSLVKVTLILPVTSSPVTTPIKSPLPVIFHIFIATLSQRYKSFPLWSFFRSSFSCEDPRELVKIQSNVCPFLLLSLSVQLPGTLRASRKTFLPHMAILGVPRLVAEPPNLCLHQHVAFSSMSASSPLLIRTSVVGFRAHLDDPR